MSQYLILSALIPLSCFELSKIFNFRHKNMILGISIGLVIAPLSFALLNFTYIPLIGKILGLIGLLFHMTHGWVGYLCLVGSGLLEIGLEITALQMVMINVVNGVLFAYVYGLIGHLIDRRIQGKGCCLKDAILDFF